jgi:3-oxoadipate enol-lactonase
MKDRISGKTDGIYYESEGEGSPIVFLHGGMMDRRMWQPQFRYFSRSNRVIRYDARGFGKSAPPRKAFSHYDDLAMLMDHWELERATMCGLSLGGRISADFALCYPDRVDKLILAGPGISGYPESPEMIQSMWEIIGAAREGDHGKATDLWLANPYLAPAMEQKHLHGRLRRIARDNAKSWMHNPLWERPLDPPAWNRITELAAPTLLILGKRDVPDIHTIVTELAKKVTGAKLARIPGAGHIVNMEKPGHFNEAMEEFLSA